jgi:glycerol transport system ATP-binding protein
LRLIDLSYRVGSETWLHDIDLSLEPGGLNVLLGATLAGKTTLLRLMAGLDRPSGGRLVIGDRDVTGVPVRQRNVAMVYQQFINYPSLSVYDNIASPLRIAGRKDQDIRDRVTSLAETLRLSPFLDRLPAQLSGGQQQRTALARALAKDAELLLLDEPLVNLDYKLREELREEFSQLFAKGRTTVVYATTEPQEALQLGGNTAVLSGGRLLQFGRTAEVFRKPATLAAARAFSDPPLNVIAPRLDADRGVGMLGDDLQIPLPAGARSRIGNRRGEVQLALRPHVFSLERRSASQAELHGRVDLAEISGSETYVHLHRDGLAVVAQIPGVHDLPLNSQCTLYFDPTELYGFDANGELLFAPEQ